MAAARAVRPSIKRTIAACSSGPSCSADSKARDNDSLAGAKGSPKIRSSVEIDNAVAKARSEASRVSWSIGGQPLAAAEVPGTLVQVPVLVTNMASELGFCWQPQRDSNPCLHLERVMSLASRRWGPAADKPVTGSPTELGGKDSNPQ
jgi:hypothetical protein